MGLYQLEMIFACLLMLSLLLRPIAARINLPFAAVLVISGVVGTSLISALGGELIIHPEQFRDLIFYVLLPILVFEAAFKIDAANLFKNIIPILLLTGPIMFISIAIASTIIYIGIVDGELFPWIAAVLTGILLSATDPVTVIEKLEQVGAPKKLILILDGEGIFNDATAIVLFSMFTYLITNPEISISGADAITMFLAIFFGGALIGLLCGLFFMVMSRLCDGPMLQALNTIISAFASFYIAESFLNVSGVMAVLITSIIMSRVIHFDYPGEDERFVERLWTLNGFVADSMVFLLTGVTLSANLFENQMAAVIISIIAILIARSASIFAFTPILNLLPSFTMPKNQQFILFWGGIKGAVPLALAFSIPTYIEYATTIQAITCGVVLFSIFIQAPTIGLLARNLKVTNNNP